MRIDSPTITGGTINNDSIGNTTPSVGTFTTLTVLGNITAGNINGATISTDANLTANSDTFISTQKAVKTYIDASSSEIPQGSYSADYTTILSDAGKHLLHPSADTSPRTFTIDSNANVAYALGTAITFVNQNNAGNLTIAIFSDTIRFAGNGAVGSRILLSNGLATALKLTSVEWIISGVGLI